MKKIATLLLCLILVFTMGMAACGGGDNGSGSDSTSAPERDRPISLTKIEKIEDCDKINFFGRTFFHEILNASVIINSASGFEVRFVGTFLKIELSAIGMWDERLSIYVDGETDSEKKILKISSGIGFHSIYIVNELEYGEHSVKVLKRTMSNMVADYVRNLETDGEFLEVEKPERLKIEFYGDSILVGEGILRNVEEIDGEYVDSNEYNQDTVCMMKSFAGVAADILSAEYRVFGRGGAALAFTPETYSVGNNWRSVALDIDVPYDYSSWKPDAVVIELGVNDYLKGQSTTPKYSETGMISAMRGFIEGCIGENYGKDIPIVLCSGMLLHDKGLDKVMDSVKESLAAEYPLLDCVVFDDCNLGHPIANQSLVYGRTLADKIEDLLQRK